LPLEVRGDEVVVGDVIDSDPSVCITDNYFVIFSGQEFGNGDPGVLRGQRVHLLPQHVPEDHPAVDGPREDLRVVLIDVHAPHWARVSAQNRFLLRLCIDYACIILFNRGNDFCLRFIENCAIHESPHSVARPAHNEALLR